MNTKVTLALMHVVGFKMPLNMIFDVEVEGLRLCIGEDLGSSWSELTVKAQVWIIMFGSLPMIFHLQNCCRIHYFLFAFMTKLYRHKSGFQSKANNNVVVKPTMPLTSSWHWIILHHIFLSFLQLWSTFGKEAELLAKSAAFLRNLSPCMAWLWLWGWLWRHRGTKVLLSKKTASRTNEKAIWNARSYADDGVNQNCRWTKRVDQTKGEVWEEQKRA